ncbi:MAG: hypothetical protein EA403_01955 [Spirochaetaceae bacterium]|nr:MAG: hypothetical protein EA403_01955 [Spirochaetaceae bacterium]
MAAQVTPGVGGASAGPLFLDELTGRMISSVDLGYSAPMVPTSIAIKPNGNLVVAAAVAAVEMDPLYRELGKPGRELFTDDRIAYAYDVTVTEAGTLFARTATGGQVFVIRPGFTRHQRIQTGIDLPATFVASADGSLLVVDATSRRAIRVEGRTTTPINIFTNEHAFIHVATAGPENTLWIWDVMTGSIIVFTTAGERIGAITPALPADLRGTVRSIRALPDGEFVVLSTQGLFRFDRDGSLLWQITQLPPPLSGGFVTMHTLALDPDRGYIYLLTITGQRIIRLIDPAHRTLSPMDAEILALNHLISANPNDPQPHVRKALLYQEAGAAALAAEAWRNVLDIDPFDHEAEQALLAAEGQILAGQARQGSLRTIELLRTLGVESARPVYTVTVQLFEQAIARLADDPRERDGVRRELEDLRRAFQDASRSRPPVPAPRVVSADLSDVFPALIRHYQSNPVGSITVRNEHDAPIEELRLSGSMRFADRVSGAASPVALAPGASAEIPVHLLLAPEVLQLQEDLPVAINLELRFRSNGTDHTATLNRAVTIRRNSALYWDDSGKLASFITPNDELVANFALEAVRRGAGYAPAFLSPRAARAAVIAETVGEFGIRYVEDPDSPFTEVFGRTGQIDTVRLPRTTLRLRVGDCDDTAALLGALYEAAGIPTAIMTSPGHVFLAFDTGEPSTNRWLYEAADRAVIDHDSSLWLPIETTILDRGFLAAWIEASRLVHTYGEVVEFLPLAGERERFPAIPLPPASFEVALPDGAQTAARLRAGSETLTGLLYDRALVALETAASIADPRTAARLRNQIGVLHARSGNLEQADTAFRAVIAGSPDFAPAHLNLGNLALLQGDLTLALRSAETAQRLRPRSAAAHLIRAQALQGLGHNEDARTAIDDLRLIDPALAQRYSYLIMPGGDARAAAAQNQPITAWERD